MPPTATYAYDFRGEIFQIIHFAPDTSITAGFVYVHDERGNMTSVTSLDGVTTYEYDATGQLTKAVLPGGRTLEYEFDALGNSICATDNGLVPTTNRTTSISTLPPVPPLTPTTGTAI